MKTRLTKLEEENKLEEVANLTEQGITGLKTTQVYVSVNMEKNAEEFQSFEKEILLLKRRNIRLEAYTRRESIKLRSLILKRMKPLSRSAQTRVTNIICKKKINN